MASSNTKNTKVKSNKTAEDSIDSNTIKKAIDTIQDYYCEEEYKIWKKNTPFLYDILVTTELEWPSNTIEWLPDTTRLSNRNYDVHRFVVGTRTNETDPNFLTVHRLNLPIMDTKNVCLFPNEEDTQGGYGQASAKLENYVKIPHDGDVNRARVMPQNSYMIATQSSNKKVFLFDISKHASEPSGVSRCRPLLTMAAQTDEGNSLSWNGQDEGKLLSCTEDGNVYLWDVLASSNHRSIIDPLNTFRQHSGIVGDVQWHQFHPSLFGSVGSDRKINIWDCRSAVSPNHSIADAHPKDINAITFNPHSEYIFLTGSDDKTIALWDMRNLKVRLHQFEGHNGPIDRVNWSPFHETVFASCGADKRVMIWDICQMYSPDRDDSEEPAELIFVHGGHTDVVADFSWNQKNQFLMASVADNNILQIWKQIGVTNPYSDNYFNPGLNSANGSGGDSSVSDGDA